ncbi:MAG: DNA polymerase III subunit epsilon [Alphaproteobacteria bacterium]
MVREIVLDTETTGLDPKQGHRIVEIGALELVNHVCTGRSYHQYINPERDMPDEAFRVHGISEDFLRDQPVFSDVAKGFLDFVQDSPFVIHNAEFDMKFLNWEYEHHGFARFAKDRAVDTLAMARRRFPGAPASLDALCKRFGIDTSSRDLHGALIDARLLADVYLELKGGREPGLMLGLGPHGDGEGEGRLRPTHGPRPRPLAHRLSGAEEEAHAAFIESLGSDDPVWRWAG